MLKYKLSQSSENIIAICFLSIWQERQRVGELIEISDKYIASGTEVVWISFDTLAEQAGFKLPAGVHWLRLCEPKLRSGSLWEAQALAIRLAPVLNYLAPTLTIPFHRAAQNVIRLCKLIVDDSLPSWLWLLLRLTSPNRYSRLRKETAVNINAVAEIFDAIWYSKKYQIYGKADEITRYFLHVGQYLSHSPHPLFWASWYAERYLKASPSLPLAHYFQHSINYNLNPNPFFSNSWYKKKAELIESKKNALVHYIQKPSNINPNPLFDVELYKKIRPNLQFRTILEDFFLSKNPPCPIPIFERIPSLLKNEKGQKLSCINLFETAFAYRQAVTEIYHIKPYSGQKSRRFAICTAITGNYDLPHPIKYADAQIDYYLISNSPIKKPLKHWKKLCVPVPHGRDFLKHSRYIKMHVAEIIPNSNDYDAIAYADANLQFAGPLAELFHEFLESSATIGLINHPLRYCVYQEAAAIIFLQKDTYSNVMRVVDFLLSEAFPAYAGLFEMNLFMFKPNLKSRKIFDDWWYLFEKFGNRDQLLFPFLLSKNILNVHTILPEGASVRNIDSIVYHPHACI